LELAAGILPSQVSLIRTSTRGVVGSAVPTPVDSLAVVINGSNQQILIENYFSASNAERIEEIRFADGTVWTTTDIAARLINNGGTPQVQVDTSANDVFQVDHPGDTISTAFTGDVDSVVSSVTWTLSGAVNLTLSGVLSIDGTGTSASNTITGNSGDNRLTGGGGVDWLIGGAGDDTYVVDWTASSVWGANYLNVDDTVTELANEGFDTLRAASYSATLPAHVERLIALTVPNLPFNLSGAGGQDVRRTFRGNTLDNVIDASGAGDRAFGAQIVIDGGAGADILIGGSADNVFVVDNVGDVVQDRGYYSGGENLGRDRVEASVTFTLGQYLEDLTLTGSAAIDGIGNEVDNVLDGSSNSAANVLVGGAGDDRYVIGVGDTVVESEGNGLDTVVVGAGPARVVSIASTPNVENAEIAAAAGASSLVGNAGDNRLFGNASANSLDGGAGNDLLIDGPFSGSGTDTLLGGSGDDELRSWDGSDVLDGGEGNDLYVQETGWGARSYVFRRGGGTDRLVSSAYAVGSTARLAPVAGISEEDLTLARDGRDLLFGISADTAQLRVVGFFVDESSFAAQHALADVAFASGATWTQSEIINRLRATLGAGIATSGNDAIAGTPAADSIDALDGNDVVFGAAGDDSIVGGAGDDDLRGELGNDTLVGGAGNDTLRGGYGGDTYVFGSGWGADVVADSASFQSQDGGVDTIAFGAGIAPTDIELSVGPDSSDADLLVRHRISGDTIRVVGFFRPERGLAGRDDLERMSFADGTVWDRAELATRGAQIFGTADPDWLYALPSGARLFGLGGDDSLWGGAGSDRLDGGLGADSMQGLEGDDSYVVDSTLDSLYEAPLEGTDTVEASITYSLAADFENLVLTGAAAINGTGNAAANTLTGNGAANVLNGGAGADTLRGGGGDDTYVVDNTGDAVLEDPSAGSDLVQASVTFVLPANVERLTLTGTGAINATGNALLNTLIGNSGANVLDGGLGADSMQGGGGNDTYVVDDAGDTVVENASAGTDTVRSAISYTLGANVENLVLLGTANINGTGNSAVNRIDGNAGANILNGGAGADTMVGGAGDDTYVVDATGDVVTEGTNAGIDLVQSGVTHTLGANVEHLTLTGTGAINGTGNGLDNVITGNSGNNALAGGAGNDTLNPGSAGTDSLLGGTGNDTYVVGRSTGITITENAGEGTDAVQASVTYTLGANLENLTLTGTGAINGTGNTLDNVLTGNSGNNTLTGGAGNDTLDAGSAGTDGLAGGTGNDVYIIARSSGITVTENAAEGTDTVRAGVTYVLGANVENLELTGGSAIDGTGNALANQVLGNSAGNRLTGAGGNDALRGGDGADVYVYNANDGQDTIDNVSGDTAIDRLTFNSIARTSLSFARAVNDLVITVGGNPANSVRVTGWFVANGNRVDQIETSGGVITTADQVDALVNGGGSAFPNGAPLTTLREESDVLELLAAEPSSWAMVESPFDVVAAAAAQPVDSIGPPDTLDALRLAMGTFAAEERVAIHMVRDPAEAMEVAPPTAVSTLDDSAVLDLPYVRLVSAIAGFASSSDGADLQRPVRPVDDWAVRRGQWGVGEGRRASLV
jgi:Ca2+-binding RTX toxin-like protein